MMDKLKIELTDWEYTCADGCCYEYGTELTLNGEVLQHPDGVNSSGYVGSDVINALTAVLTKLGYEIEIISK